MKFGFKLSFRSPKSQFVNINFVNINGVRVTELIFKGELNKWIKKSFNVGFAEGDNSFQMELS